MSVDSGDWQTLWAAVAADLLRRLDAGDLAGFETAFPVVAEALTICDASGRQAAMRALFGDFTRHAIGAGFDRTRFVAWFGPAELLAAAPGRVRGRVLYFKHEGGHGRILGADGTIYFVHFSMIRDTDRRTTPDGFVRPVDGGQLVEFTPRYATFNSGPGLGAYDVSFLDETARPLEA